MSPDLWGEPHGSPESQRAPHRKRTPRRPRVPARATTPAPVLTWSYGGGTQSIAIALLVAMGKLPTPDLIVMADTSFEATETWEYTFAYVLPLLDTIGLTIEIAPHELATVDDYGKNGDLLVPVYTETGKFSTYCSSEWKKAVLRRYLRQVKGVERCVTWLGMSTDEVERLKPSDVQWQEHVWPLCGLPREYDYGIRLSRADCRQLILDSGWPEPPKSSCWKCPHRRNPQWQRLKRYYPRDFARACQFDEQIRARDPLHAVYLHESRQPLATVDFARPDTASLFGEENGGCQSGYCFT